MPTHTGWRVKIVVVARLLIRWVLLVGVAGISIVMTELWMLLLWIMMLVLVVAWLVIGLLGVRGLPVPRIEGLHRVRGMLAAVEGVTTASFMEFVALIVSMTQALL